MRILIVTEFLPASDDAEITGGVEAYVHYVSRLLRQHHDVTVISRPTDGSVWDDASLASLPGRILFLLRAFVRALTTPADVIVATTFVVHPMAWVAGKLRRTPVVFWYPDVLIGTWRGGQFAPLTGLIGETVERFILRRRVAHWIAISESTAAKLRQNGVDAGTVDVVPCGFDPTQLPVPTATCRPDSVTVVSRLVNYKRVDVVVEAVARVAATRSGITLTIVGQGPERGRLEQLASDLGISDKVEFRGFVARHRDVLDLVASSAAFVSASEIEGFGIVVVEAMAAGVPYVVSDIPAHREVTGGGIGGRLVDPGDPAEMASALDAVLGADRDTLGRAGREWAARYTWAEVARATEDILRRVSS